MSRVSSAPSTYSPSAGVQASCFLYVEWITCGVYSFCFFWDQNSRIFFFFCFFLPPPGKLPLESSQPMGRLSSYAHAVSCAAEWEFCVMLFSSMFQKTLNHRNNCLLSFSALLKIPDEILLHLSAGLLVARTPGTLFPKDKEGECVFWLVFRPWVYILFDFPWLFCIVLKNYILYY